MMTDLTFEEKVRRIFGIPVDIDISSARIDETKPGRWTASAMQQVSGQIDGVRAKVAEVVTDMREISAADAIAELTRRGDMIPNPSD